MPTPTQPRKGRAASADAPPSPDDVLQQFRIVFNAVKTHFRKVERRSGIGGAQIWALSAIRQRPGLGVGELAVTLNVKQPTASIIVRNLVQQGLVDSRREGADRRSVQLHITGEGRAVLRRAPGPHAGILPQALQSLPQHSLAALATGLADLIDALGADAQAAQTPLAQSASTLE